MAAKPRTRITLKCVKIVTRIYTLLNPNEKRSRTKTALDQIRRISLEADIMFTWCRADKHHVLRTRLELPNQ